MICRCYGFVDDECWASVVVVPFYNRPYFYDKLMACSINSGLVVAQKNLAAINLVKVILRLLIKVLINWICTKKKSLEAQKDPL